MRRYDELDVHHCLLIDFHDLEAVLGELSHVDQLVQLIEVFGELYDVFGVGIFGDQRPTV